MNKKLKLTALIMLILIFITSGGVFANFQSSPNVSAASKNFDTWISGVRQMEASGQVMGLNETCDTSTLVAENSNNIDVHLQKNTEYGTMLILAVSDFGKQGNGESESEYINSDTYGLATTTGNTSGIYMNNHSEYVAAGYPTSSFSKALYNADVKYKNTYTSQGSFGYNAGKSPNSDLRETITGDAMDIYNWQNGTKGYWLYGKYSRNYSSRANTNGYNYYYYWDRTGFGFSCAASYTSSDVDAGYLYSGSLNARAVVVCGNGI